MVRVTTLENIFLFEVEADMFKSKMSCASLNYKDFKKRAAGFVFSGYIPVEFSLVFLKWNVWRAGNWDKGKRVSSTVQCAGCHSFVFTLPKHFQRRCLASWWFAYNFFIGFVIFIAMVFFKVSILTKFVSKSLSAMTVCLQGLQCNSVSWSN